jgi:GNAT superfamily N-acetyltransferase
MPHRVEVRRVTKPDDLGPVADLESEVWGEDLSWHAEELAEQMSLGPDKIGVYVAEAERNVVAAAWLLAYPSTDFAGLYGGATLDRLRGRGVFRVLVRERAKLAASRGAAYLQVDASAHSRPILEKVGLVPVTTTVPYVWKP